MKTIAAFGFSIILLLSCNKNNQGEDSTIKSVTSFINETKNITVFGKIKTQSILNKAEYQKIPKIGLVLSSVINEFKNTVDLNNPIYYALEGPFDKNAMPNTIYAFIKIQSSDSLIDNLTQKGYDFNKAKNFDFTEIGKISIGISNNLAIIITKQNKINSEKELAIIFEKTRKQSFEKENKIGKILKSNEVIVIGVNYNSLYSTANTELNKLSIDKQNELNDITENSYSKLSISFNKGELKLITENYISEKFKEILFLKDNNSTEQFITKLGNGSPRMGLTLNLDLNKIENFISKYTNTSFTKLAEKIGGPLQMAIMMGGEKPLSNLFSGEFGAIIIGEPKEDGTFIPDFNIYLGLGKKGKPLAEMAQSFLSNGTMKTIVDRKGIYCYSSEKNMTLINSNLNLPDNLKDFGLKPISGFINLKDMDMSSFELTGGLKIFNIIESIKFNMDNKKGEIVITSKDKSKNILKSSIDFYQKELETQINKIGL
jgi:hypothetical protein